MNFISISLVTCEEIGLMLRKVELVFYKSGADMAIQTNVINKEFQHFVESQLIEVRMTKMHLIQFASILNLIQMKLMKVSHRLQNMMNKEFRHFVESQLIKVRMMKMQMIQFVSRLNLIQMKLMKVSDILKNMMNKEFQHFVES
jgi:hypothetical protein